MEYTCENIRYTWSYIELREKYMQIVGFSEDEFMDRLPEILHTACFICYVKEEPLNRTLSDMGIIHELAHLIHIPDESMVDLPRVMETFKIVCELV